MPKQSKGKLPAFQFYTGDWLKDPNLSLCSPATRGIFMDLLSAMHENDRSGRIVGTSHQLSRLARCTVAEMEAALTELHETATAEVSDVTFCNGPVTVTNRRMRREWRERKSNAERVKRHRQRSGNVESDGGVTGKSRLPSSSSVSSSETSSPNTSCPEPAAPASEPNDGDLVVMDFPVVANGPEPWHLQAKKLGEYADTYPGLEVGPELRRARQWLIDNPSRRKTPRGMPRFLNGWLERAQNAGRGGRKPIREPEGGTSRYRVIS